MLSARTDRVRPCPVHSGEGEWRYPVLGYVGPLFPSVLFRQLYILLMERSLSGSGPEHPGPAGMGERPTLTRNQKSISRF